MKRSTASYGSGWMAAAAFACGTLTACGPGKSPQQQVVSIAPPPAAVFPLHVEAGKRYLVDAAGKPFFVNGDSPWELISQLKREDVDLYLENRRLKGVNAVLVELMEHFFSANPPNNAYGDPPFTTPGDFATPNEAYFVHVDYVINKAAEKGMVVLLTPAYLGFNGGQEGWYQEMIANGTAKLLPMGNTWATATRASTTSSGSTAATTTLPTRHSCRRWPTASSAWMPSLTPITPSAAPRPCSSGAAQSRG
jgi:hypothetical protein